MSSQSLLECCLLQTVLPFLSQPDSAPSLIPLSGGRDIWKRAKARAAPFHRL